jgi:hypothetical protein
MAQQWGNAVECLMARCRQYRTGINDEYVRSLVEFQKFLIWFPVLPRTYSYLQHFSGSCHQKLQLNCSECRLITWHTVINRTASSSREIHSLSKRSTFPSHHSPQTFVRVITSTLSVVTSSRTMQYQAYCKISLGTVRPLGNKIPHHRKTTFWKLLLSSSCEQIVS